MFTLLIVASSATPGATYSSSFDVFTSLSVSVESLRSALGILDICDDTDRILLHLPLNSIFSSASPLLSYS